MASRNKLTDPNEIIAAFQKRQKRVVVAFFICALVMIPSAIKARTINATLALAVIIGCIVPLFAFYLWTFRCPACGTRVQQRRRMLHLPIRCSRCGVLLDTR